jgi:hypothetical protein
MDEYKFVLEDPPPRGQNTQPWDLGGKTDVSAALAFVQAHPGRWARVWSGGGYGANNRKALLEAAGCETRTARIDSHSSMRHLYARWVSKDPSWVEDDG